MTETLRFNGRILFLTDSHDLLRAQLEGRAISTPPRETLIDAISTDEITPAWVCFWYDETLGLHTHVGLRNGAVQRGEIKAGGFDILVSGRNKGCGSSRETAPYSERYAGIRLVIAESFEKIYRQNCQNIGLHTSTDFGLLERIRGGEPVPLAELTEGLDPISRAIVEAGGLSAFNRQRLAGEQRAPDVDTESRPMTAVEKIVAHHARTSGAGRVDAVAPGDSVFCRTDVRFTHDYVTPMTAAIFENDFGGDAALHDVSSIYAFRDHLTFLGDVMPEEKRAQGLLVLADDLATVQARFCEARGIRLYGEADGGGSEAICHNAMVEEIALPGQLVVGTDSHTCTAGALGCFAFGVGATDMANAWYTGDVRVTVPETLRVVLSGELPTDVYAKDVMLALMALPYFQDGHAVGQVIEFHGSTLVTLSIDERATLTNMAVEAGATTAFISPDSVTREFLRRSRGANTVWQDYKSDPDAEFAATLELDVSALTPMVATPGDPRNGRPLNELGEAVPIDIAYGGSCTGGKDADMDQYASVFRKARAFRLTVAEHVRCFIQFGSQRVKSRAFDLGYVELFESMGVELVNPACGACIKAGPGVSIRPGEVTVSAINRNFPGRSGPGRVYLTSPAVVAASAIAGRLIAPGELFGE